MSDERVERLAMAIWENGEEVHEGSDVEALWADEPERIKDSYRGTARAVIPWFVASVQRQVVAHFLAEAERAPERRWMSLGGIARTIGALDLAPSSEVQADPRLEVREWHTVLNEQVGIDGEDCALCGALEAECLYHRGWSDAERWMVDALENRRG